MMKHLFTPMKIGSLEIPNRTVVPAMVTNYCNSDGTATERYIAYHEEKAKGCWGLIITEDYAIEPRGRGFSCVAGLWNDAQIDGHAELPRRIHQSGSKIFAQIYHAGRQTSQRVIGTKSVAPSPIPCPTNPLEIPHELTVAGIQEIVEQFGDTALRAKKAGFDGVEVHGAHGYLIAQFMSPYSNKRTDQYGGSLTNRVRFPLEVVANIRAKVGPDFPICFRISGDEFVTGGRTILDTKAIAVLLEEAGVDVLHVTGGVYASVDQFIPSAGMPHGNLVPFAAEVKKVVGIPVITVSRINDPLLAESVISSGSADFVGMARASLADPALPKKAAEGRFEDINPCIGCLQGCINLLFEDQPIQCMVNPALGCEIDLEIREAAEKQTVLVAGGGPAGMEAAIVAAKAGHQVKLYESRERLGGQFYLASMPPAKGEFASFTNWQITQLQKLGVEVELNTVVTQELVDAVGPDSVVVATGAKPIVPVIPGVERENVVNSFAVLSSKVAVCGNVVLIGNGMTAVATANYLVNHGSSAVTIVETLPGNGKPVPPLAALGHLLEKSVGVLSNLQVLGIEDDGVVVGDGEMLPADYVVLSVGTESVNELSAQLEGKPYQVVTIGDASNTRNALAAIREGYMAGLAIGRELVAN